MSDIPEPDQSEDKTEVIPPRATGEPAGAGVPKPPETPPAPSNRPETTAPGRPVPPSAPSHSAPVGKPAAPPSGIPGPAYTPPRPKRTSAQIRADIDDQREELGGSVDALRDRVTELTDWRSQIRKHRKQIVVGAVATGFVVGGLMALRRR